MGWIGAAVPEEYGGAGLGSLAVCVLAEEIGRAVAPVPFSSSVYLAIEALMAFGSPAQKKAYLPGLVTGGTIGTFAAAEQPGALRLDMLKTRHSDGRVTGVKLAVPDGDIADVCVVAASDAARGAVLCLVDLSGPGVNRATVATIRRDNGVGRSPSDIARGVRHSG